MLLDSPLLVSAGKWGGEGHYTDEESVGWRHGKASMFWWEIFDVFCVRAEEGLDVLAFGHFCLWFDLILFI